MTWRTKSTNSVLLVIDVQEKIVTALTETHDVLQNIEAMVRAAKVLKIPVVITEQEKLGDIAPEIKRLLGREASRFKKLTFSCCGVSAFRDKIQRLQRKTILACGVETHICVMQTVLDLLELNYNVLVLRDATSSYRIADRETAIERMRDAGAKVSTTESTIYELMQDAGRLEFKAILAIVKALRLGSSATL